MTGTPAWVDIVSTRDLASFGRFERAFRHLQSLAEHRTGTRLPFSRVALRSVFRTHAARVSAEMADEGRGGGLPNLPVRMPSILAGTLLRAFEAHDFGRPGALGSASLSRAAPDERTYFILAFCVEYYLFLTYKRLGHDYVPSLDPDDVALVEYIVDAVGSGPADARSDGDHQLLFRNLGKNLGFDPG